MHDSEAGFDLENMWMLPEEKQSTRTKVIH